jgi:two-component system cell cycle response regulator
MPDRNGLSKVLACQSLPSLPTVGVQVLTLTRDPDVSMDQIAKVIETDLALSAKVLKTVNSSVYGLKSPCTTIRRALNYLGLSAVKSIVLGFSLVESTRGVSGDDSFDINDHWRRSIFGAAAARVIAQKVGRCDPEEAFAAALFQDLGVLAMFTALGAQYTSAVAPAAKDHSRHPALETAALGFTHTECGAALAAKWRLPDRYVQTIQHHHAPNGADPDCRDLVRVVGLGTLTAAALTSENAADELPALLASARLWFNISAGDMALLLGEVGRASAELARLFGKQVGVIPDAAALMHEANEELVNQQIAAAREADSLREKNEALVRQTITDALTGIGNRKRFNDEAERLFAESATIGRCFALIMCDGDKFKSVNDAHGHHVGDAVLRELARRISEAAGTSGTACRYGGEEFAILLPGASIAEAAAIAELARKAVQTPEFDLSSTPGAPPTLPITISLGVACNDPSGSGAYASLTSVIEAADKALYAAKHAGRNRVCLEKPPAPAAGEHGAPGAAPAPQASVPSSVPVAKGALRGGVSVPAAHGATSRPRSPGPVKILLVEDDSLAARMILAVLAKSPMVEAEWVKSVPLALKRLAEGAASPTRSIYAVVSDLTLAGGTGIDIISAIRANPQLVGTPVVIVSACDDASMVQRCVAAGASAFINKDNLLQQLPAWVTGILADPAHARAA